MYPSPKSLISQVLFYITFLFVGSYIDIPYTCVKLITSYQNYGFYEKKELIQLYIGGSLGRMC